MKQWFEFHPIRFQKDKILALQDKIKKEGRYLVAINDPHIFARDGYFVFDDIATEEKKESNSKTSILVLQPPDWSVEDDKTTLGSKGLFYKYFSG